MPRGFKRCRSYIIIITVLLGGADGLLHSDRDVYASDLVRREDAGETTRFAVSTLLGQVLAAVDDLKEAPVTKAIIGCYILVIR